MSAESAAATWFAAAATLPFFVYALVGSYTRYTADDFCWAGILRTEGFVDAQIHYYTIYSPRYAFTFLVNLAELVGPAIVPSLPAAAITVWLAALSWTFTRFGVGWFRAFILAEVAALATFFSAPDLPQSLYWQTGMLTYLLPLILATFLIGWIRRAPRTWSAVALCGLVTFVAGGLSEAYLIPQNVSLTLSLGIALATRSGRSPHLAAALVGGVLALATIVFSPSIESRVGGPPADLWLALSAAIATAVFEVVRLVRFFPYVVILAVGVPALVGPYRWRIAPRWVIIATAAIAVTLPFCYFPSFYAQNGNPPARSLIVPGAILVGYLLLLGFALSPVLVQWTRPLARAISMAFLAFIPLAVGFATVPDQANAVRYAAQFDAEEQQIRTARDSGQLDLTVPPLPPNLGEPFVGSDRSDWFNQCVARYYGVRSIATPAS